MALAEFANGSQAATIGTTHTLSTPTSGKTYVLHIDLSVMTATDQLDIYMQTKVKSASTIRTMFSVTLAGVQAAPNYMTIPVPSFNGCAFQIKQTAGTGRTF